MFGLVCWTRFLECIHIICSTGTDKPLYDTDEGFAVARGNDFGGASNTAPVGNFTQAPYSYTLLAVDSVRSSVTASAGQTLAF